MRTALYLLGVLAVAVFIGTVIPQRPNVPQTVDRWLAGDAGPAASSLGTDLGTGIARLIEGFPFWFYDVFGAPWFIALVGLLFTSLTACLIPRYRAFWRMWRRGRPPRSRNLDAHPKTAELATDAPASRVMAVARDVLRGRRYRLRGDQVDVDDGVALQSDMRRGVVAAPADDSTGGSRDGKVDGDGDEVGSGGGDRGGQIAAEKGHLVREGGSLAFHTAFYLLLVGIIVGELTSFAGQIGVVEGQTMTDTSVAYWTRDAGRWWRADHHTGFSLTLDRFDVDWTENGQPVGFRSHVTVDPAAEDREPYQAATFVNSPLVIDGMKVHQLDWGYATRVVVRHDGREIYNDWVTMNAAQGNVWRGAVKAPGADPQLGLDVNLIPEAVQRDGELRITGWPGAEAPLLVFTSWVGDLRMDRVQNVNRLDTTAMRELSQGALRQGQTTRLPTGATVEFAELKQWVGFQVSRRPTVPLLLVAAGLLLAALFPALYAYRRRVWVRANTDADPGGGEHDTPPGRTLVTVAGHAYQRQEAFDGEFADVVEEIRRRLDRPPVSDRGRPASGDGEPARELAAGETGASSDRDTAERPGQLMETDT